MNCTQPPACWRSEAFAEDLPEDATALVSRSSQPAVAAVRTALLGAVPLLLAAAGAVTSAWAGSV